MKGSKLSPLLLYFAVSLHILSVAFFLHGFLWHAGQRAITKIPVEVDELPNVTPALIPSAEHVEMSSNESTSSITASASRVKRIVIFLIDALRADFVFSSDSRLNFLTGALRHGRGMGFTAKAQTPTVTLPRLKALTTGAVPNFVDVILNFGTQTAVNDNFIDRMKLAGKRIAFYGDDTWLRMFPTSFVRSEGVTSFLVSDYTEVDNNVTRNLAEELERDDWDVLVLHYLGLDHIGHLSGSRSSLVEPKLREMDGLIRRIYRVLEEKKEPSLLVVLGDHGMTDAGSHGGGTDAEINTPMVFLSPSFPRKIGVSPNTPPASIKQVDLASTISLLTGTPIPADNTGVFILQVLRHFLSTTELQSAVCQLSRQLQLAVLKFENESMHELRETRRIFCSPGNVTFPFSESDIQNAADALRMVASELSATASEYGIVSICLSFLLMGSAFVLYCIVLSNLKLMLTVNTVEIVSGVWMVFHAVSLTSSSFIEEEHQLWYISIPSALSVLLLSQNGSWLANKGVMGKLLGLLVLHRLMREWNRTGDKWAHLPDIGDWLREPDNAWTLYGLIGLSIAIHAGLKKSVPLITGLTFTFFFHYSQRNLFAWLAYIVSALHLVSVFFMRRQPHEQELLRKERWLRLRSVFVNVACVIVRPHNMPLIALMCCLERLLGDVAVASKLTPKQVAFLYFLHGWATFFYFGNANAISSVDVSAGFAGITVYCAPLHGLLIFLQVYIGPIFWLLSLICRIPCSAWQASAGRRAEVVTLFLFFRLVCVAVAFGSAALQRHHLFVWTVFAPKVLYESVHSVFACLIAVISLSF